MAVLGLVCKAVPSRRLNPSGRIMSQILFVPGSDCKAVPTGRLMSSERIISQGAKCLRGG